ncbi:MAG: hypothetical protein NVV72_00415 [Asticcacaulis sp.]|nr:hypothetical protein [Asticcacaulis sp.]
MRILSISLLLTAASIPAVVAAKPAAAPSPPPVVRQMTLDEKVGQLQAAAPAIPRLGVTAYNWWNEGLHGIARIGDATVFPQAIGLAATSIRTYCTASVIRSPPKRAPSSMAWAQTRITAAIRA